MDNIVYLTLFLLTLINIYGFLYSYLITDKLFFTKNKIQSKMISFSVLKERTPLVLFNIIILMILTVIGLVFFREYYIKDYISITYVVLEVIFVLIIDDFFFYILHRKMHENKYIYKKIHKIHHRANTPIPFDYIYVHPFEWLSGFIGPFIGMLMLGGISIYSFWIYLIVRNIHEIHIHSGIRSLTFTKLVPFYGNNEHHDLHHAKRDGNYSSTFTLWDKIFKTKLNM